MNITSDYSYHIKNLPPEIVTNIISYLSPKDCFQVSLTCKSLFYTIQEPSYWKIQLNRLAKHHIIKKLPSDFLKYKETVKKIVISLFEKIDEERKRSLLKKHDIIDSAISIHNEMLYVPGRIAIWKKIVSKQEVGSAIFTEKQYEHYQIDPFEVKERFNQFLKKRGNLSKITKLNLSGVSLQRIPPEIIRFKWLSQLNLSNNLLTHFPTNLPSSITNLCLNKNQIKVIPKEVQSLSKLKELHLYKNQICKIANEIGQLNCLTTLNLCNNQLITLQVELPKTLKTLNLSANQLKQFPEKILSCQNLTRLFLNNNKIELLPNTITLLSNLHTLSLASNQLKSLPSSIATLNQLKNLNLYKNLLTDLNQIPVYQLNSLEKFNISLNKIENLPSYYFTFQLVKGTYKKQNLR